MTKPNNFIANSDFLALAQTGRSDEFVVNFPAKVYPSQGYNFWDADNYQDFYFPTVKGAIDKYRIKIDGASWVIGNSLTQVPNFNQNTMQNENGGYMILIYRLNANTIRVRCVRIAPGGTFSAVPTAPAVSLRVRGVAFRPPNAF